MRLFGVGFARDRTVIIRVCTSRNFVMADKNTALDRNLPLVPEADDAVQVVSAVVVMYLTV